MVTAHTGAVAALRSATDRVGAGVGQVEGDSMTNGITAPVTVSRVHFGRQPSWVVHNRLQDDRTSVEGVVRRVLERPPADFQVGTPVFARAPGVDVLFAVLDEPAGDAEPFVVVLAVQPPLSSTSPSPGKRANCHWMTEIWPSVDHSIIPVTYEFARGPRPQKRLNFVVDDGDGTYRRLDNGASVTAGFRHFVSAAYSHDGLAMLDFYLTVRHRPPTGGHDDRGAPFAQTRAEFVDVLRRDLRYPLAEIENELYEDRGRAAPSDIREIGALFSKILSQLTDTAYSNLDLFKQEWVSNINPRLHERGVGAEMVVPLDVGSSVVVDEPVGLKLVRCPGALEALLMLVDRRANGALPALPEALVPVDHQAAVIEVLVGSGLAVDDGTGLRATVRGEQVVAKLRESRVGVAAHGCVPAGGGEAPRASV